jgi:hypothetical protein
MRRIRKAQTGMDTTKRAPIKMAPKKDTAKTKDYYKLKKDPQVSSDFVEQLKKKGPMSPSGIKKKFKSGGKQMLKRADGSVSQRGLWDNIRAAAKRNKAAGKRGKKPTAAMLKQERKIKAKGK